MDQEAIYFIYPLFFERFLFVPPIIQGMYVDALLLCERTQAIREKAFGPDHPCVARSLKTKAQVLMAQVADGTGSSIVGQLLKKKREAILHTRYRHQ